MERFLKPISHQLQYLRLNVKEDLAYLDADRWKRLLEKHMPHLSELNFTSWIHFYNDDFFLTDYRGLCSFCNKNNWCLEFNLHPDECILSIRPWTYSRKRSSSRKNSADSFNAIVSTNDINLNSYILPAVQLTLACHAVSSIDQVFIDKMKSSSIRLAFTHLNIAYVEILHGLLIELISLLPNLHSIELRGMSFPRDKLPSIKTATMFSTVSMNNKIAKVKLHAIDDFQEIDFLMEMFPRMEYFEIDCMTENDVINVVAFITRNSVKHMRYLQCLCISVPNADESLIDNLKDIVDSERPFYPEEISRDYKIHRIGNTICVGWKI